jgi:hypothetical protein
VDYRLSPSDLTFLYDSCKHCFVLKVKHGVTRPSIPIPGIFSIIASLQKNYYSGKRTEEFCPQLPPGTVTFGEKRIRSGSVKFDDLESTCYISGRFDVVVEFDDGSYGVIDFKTGNLSDEKTEMYSRQLHAYAYALENPAEGALRLHPVSRLGLLYFTPDVCKHIENTRQVIEGPMTWLEIKRDDSSFRDFLRDVLLLLDGPLPAPEPEACDWCRYRQTVVGLTGGAGEEGGPNQQAVAAPPSCPQCGGPMRLRSGEFGKFWGCLSYPDCRGKRPA